jgi:serine/threonine protein kinase
VTIYLSERVRFGIFELNVRTGELVSTEAEVDGSPAPKVLLREQPFQILRILVERHGKIVSREEIKRVLWPNDTIVDFDRSINVAMAILRKAVGDAAENPRYIETLPRRGYRLMIPVEWQESVGETPKIIEDVATSPSLQPIRGGGLTGKRISHYRVLEVLGGGGMGVVYKAEDLKLGRRVALKFLPEETAEYEPAIQRFKREAQTASALNHPNICTIYEIDEYEGQPFIAMELLYGEALSTRLAAVPGPLAITAVLDIAIQVCSALQAAHANGIIHRDVKPANIFLTKDGSAKILDFGLAKLDSGEKDQWATATDTSSRLSEDSEEWPPEQPRSENRTSFTLTGTALGTAGYMSPEQIRKEELDSRTDLFSFGLVLYEMATGTRAFQGDSVADVHEAILHRAPASLREIKASVPRRLDIIISKALEKDRARRYQSAAEMRKDLLQVQEELRPVGHSARNWLVTAASLLVLLAAGTLYWHTHSEIALASSDTLVRADMDNRTGDKALGDGMDLALRVALEQTPYLNLLGRDKMRETLRELGLGEDTRVTPQIALQVCRKTNSRAVISAFIADIGNRYRVGLNTIDCQSGKMLEEVANEASTRGDIVRTLGLSAFQLRRKLGESRDSLRKFNQPLDQATSSSPDALEFLDSGYKKQLSGDIPGALSDYEAAVEGDPNLALAYAAEGSGNKWLDREAVESLDVSKAFELRNRLTIPARFHVETLYYGNVRNEWDKDCPIAQEWVQTFPRDVIARMNFGGCLNYIGRHDEALVQFREAARLLPSDPTLKALLITAIYAGRFDEAKEVYNEAIARGFDSPELHMNHALLAFHQNDESEMQKEWAWALKDRARGRFVLSTESMIEGFYGRSRNADRLARIGAESSMKAGLSSYAAFFLSAAALREAENGNPEQAQLLVTDALRKSRDRTTLMFAALTLARAGNIEQSQKLVDALSQSFPDNFSVQAFMLPCVRAAIKLSENDPSGALEILRPVEPYDLATTDDWDYVYPAFLRGLAYLQLKQGSLAADQFRKVLDHPGVWVGFVTGSLSVLQLARAQVLMDDTGAAQKSYADFLTLWKDADSDLPIYREAKREYASLRNSQ